MKTYFWIFVFLFLSFRLNAQQEHKIDSLKKLIEHEKNDTSKVNLLNELASVYYLKSLPEHHTPIFNVSQEALNISRKSNFKKGEIFALTNLGKAYVLKEDYKKAYTLLAQANKLNNNNIGNITKIILYNLAYISYRQDNYELSIEYNQKLIKYLTKKNDSTLLNHTLNGMAISYSILGNTPKALETFFKALNISKQQNDTIGMSSVYINIANVYEELEDYNNAIKFNELTIKILNNKNDYVLYVALFNIGNVKIKQKKYDESLDILNKALKYCLKNKNTDGAANCYNAIGINYKEKDQHDKAKEYLKKSLQDYTKIKSKNGIAEVNLTFAEIYFDENNTNKALKHTLISKNIFEELSSKENLLKVYELLSKIYSKQNKYKLAYNELEKYKILKDTLNNTETTKKITQLQMQYNFDKEKEKIKIENDKKTALKNKEIEYHKNENKILITSSIILIAFIIIVLILFFKKKRINQELIIRNSIIENQKEEISLIAEELKESNDTKNRFFSIIAHDLRNPFSVILGFGKLLYDNIEKYDREKIKFIINNIYKSSEHTFFLLTNLLQWARKQDNTLKIEPKKLKLKDIVTQNFDLLETQAIQKKTSLKYIENEEINIFADKDMLNTIIRNLISNAIKYTENGKIEVIAEKQNNTCKVTVTDTGAGIKPENLKTIFTLGKNTITKGTAGEKGTGLGLELCKDFVEMNNGTISAESVYGKGSSFIFTIPLFNETSQK